MLNVICNSSFIIRLSVFLIVTTLLAGCGGKLTEEQRQKIKEDMKEHKIVRITEGEITDASFKLGREMMKMVEPLKDSKSKLDSLAEATKTKIKWIDPSDKNALDVEKQLIEAYLVSSINGGIEDNIQKIGTDSLLYTNPITEKLVDGSENVKGMWSIRFSKKDLILSIDK